MGRRKTHTNELRETRQEQERDRKRVRKNESKRKREGEREREKRGKEHTFHHFMYSYSLWPPPHITGQGLGLVQHVVLESKTSHRENCRIGWATTALNSERKWEKRTLARVPPATRNTTKTMTSGENTRGSSCTLERDKKENTSTIFTIYPPRHG
jgi:hypothetical protein